VSDPVALARHYLDIERPAAALELVDRLLLEDPADSELHEIRAAALYEDGRVEAAVAAARAGLEIDPYSLPLLAVLSLAERKRGHLGDAESAILSALRLMPDNSTLLCQYAVLLAEGGAEAKGERMLERAAALAPDDDVVAQTRIALAYLGGRDKEAERHGSTLLEQDPLDPLAHSVLGTIASERGSPRKATRHFEEAARYDLDDEMVEVALESRALSHPLMLPLWPIYRLGVAKTWLLGIGGGLALSAVGLYRLASIWLIAYVLLAVYSWIAPSLIRRWVFRGRRRRHP
jgi:Tfp pilus assembly protein PilF